MRVIAGSAGGVPLEAPKQGTRPTSDLIKGALFSMLENDPAVGWGRVLDLYAGSGGLGIEALSRGAEWADFVESDRRAAEVVQRNLLRTRLAPQGCVHTLPVERALQVFDQPYDIIIADPPYEDPGVTRLAHLIAASPAFGPESTLVIEHSRRVTIEAVPGVLTLVKSRRHGDTCISIFRPTDAEPVH